MRKMWRVIEKPESLVSQALTRDFFLKPVPPAVLFSNQFLEDLDKIWELRHWIPDPTKPILPPNLTKINY